MSVGRFRGRFASLPRRRPSSKAATTTVVSGSTKNADDSNITVITYTFQETATIMGYMLHACGFPNAAGELLVRYGVYKVPKGYTAGDISLFSVDDLSMEPAMGVWDVACADGQPYFINDQVRARRTMDIGDVIVLRINVTRVSGTANLQSREAVRLFKRS